MLHSYSKFETAILNLFGKAVTKVEVPPNLQPGSGRLISQCKLFQTATNFSLLHIQAIHIQSLTLLFQVSTLVAIQSQTQFATLY